MGIEREHLDANRLGSWLEGGLGRRQRREILRHLSGCDPCRQWAACANAARPQAAAGAERAGWLRWQASFAAAACLTLALGSWWLAGARPGAVPRAGGQTSAPAGLTAGAAPRAGAQAAPIAPVAIHRLGPSLPARPARRRASNDAFVVPAPVTLATVEEPAPVLPAVASPSPDGEIQPSIDFAPLMTGFRDQAPMNGARAQLASWVEASQSEAPSASASAAPPAGEGLAPGALGNAFAGAGTAAPAGNEFSSGMSSNGMIASGLGWALSRGGQVLHSIGAGMWAAVPLVPGVPIRALSATETRVWAAGLASQVYFSDDRGAHWRTVQLPAVGSKAAPVRSIVFADAQHGTITASNGRVWRTSDGGGSWEAQN